MDPLVQDILVYVLLGGALAYLARAGWQYGRRLAGGGPACGGCGTRRTSSRRRAGWEPTRRRPTDPE